ncbi:Pathogenic type III effector avirulence factor Avr cleavage site [Macleaya cordata]|uniref:Pathogenic type III effector avirulence factor Avr cleavage site n=1 Tax=Macleaya cordata TaxID=56857 RepID=A0A200RBL7_MACCD|nr:Pathogenic type III effector avirulence factor Avr cleavage site [Macleaya cordata]
MNGLCSRLSAFFTDLRRNVINWMLIVYSNLSYMSNVKPDSSIEEVCAIALLLSQTRALKKFAQLRSDKGRPLPKFGEWDVNDPASAEGFSVIFNKARDERKAGNKPDSPGKDEPPVYKPRAEPGKPQSKKWFCCVQPAYAES